MYMFTRTERALVHNEFQMIHIQDSGESRRPDLPLSFSPNAIVQKNTPN